MSIYIGNKQVAGNGSNTANVLHGENIEEGLEYLVPENVGDVVAFRITGDSAQVMNSTEGFGLLGKINGSESLAIAVQKDNMNSIKQLVYTALVNNDGTGTEWNQLGASSSGDGPIPGYTKVNGGVIDCALVNGSTTVTSLKQAVPTNTYCYAEVDVITSVVSGTVKTSSTLWFFRLNSGGVICDINSRALGGTTIGQVKLNVATLISSTSFVIVTTTYDLASDVSGGVARIKNLYAQI